MSAPRRRLGTGPAPAAQASPTGPRRLPAERAAADEHRVDDDQEHAQPGRGRRPLGTRAQAQPGDVTAVFFFGDAGPASTRP